MRILSQRYRDVFVSSFGLIKVIMSFGNIFIRYGPFYIVLPQPISSFYFDCHWCHIWFVCMLDFHRILILRTVVVIQLRKLINILNSSLTLCFLVNDSQITSFNDDFLLFTVNGFTDLFTFVIRELLLMDLMVVKVPMTGITYIRVYASTGMSRFQVVTPQGIYQRDACDTHSGSFVVGGKADENNFRRLWLKSPVI